MNRRLFVYLIVSALLVAGYIFEDNWLPLLSSTKTGETGQANKTPTAAGKRGAGPTAVLVAEAKSGKLPITRQTIGTIIPEASAALTSATTGILSQVLMKDGATVKKGDLVAQLDTRTIDATIGKDKAVLLRDQATLQNSMITAKRAKELLAKGLNSQQAGNDADTASQVAAATENYDRAVLAADEVARSLTEIRAPFDGKLGAIFLSPGAFVSPGASVATITKLDTVMAEFALPDRDAALIQSAAAAQKLSVEVRSQTFAGTPAIKGPVVFVDTTIDAGTGTFKMRARLENTTGQLLAGQSVNVDVAAGEIENLVLVPNQSVVPTATGNAVYVVKTDNTIAIRPVEIALRNDREAGLSKGLTAGEKVVREGQLNLANGAQVTVAAPAKSATP
jgi:membrane fusion protein, multidrug efflux system